VAERSLNLPRDTVCELIELCEDEKDFSEISSGSDE
jgi:hypothetical protein